MAASSRTRCAGRFHAPPMSGSSPCSATASRFRWCRPVTSKAKRCSLPMAAGSPTRPTTADSPTCSCNRSPRPARNIRCRRPEGTPRSGERMARSCITSVSTATLMAVPIDTTGRFDAGMPQALFPTGMFNTGFNTGQTAFNIGQTHAVSKDGQRFLLNARTPQSGSVPPLNVVVNWMAAIQTIAMALTPGTRLGPYEVLAPLGAGGMGEVYRARDTKLDRDVALKMLPASFASDPERLARFEREAKTLASLNHPHIAQIYGFEQSGERAALVMELVEGEDLCAADRPRAAAARRGAADRAADRRGARGRARAGDHPPRSEARQHQGARRRRREGAGFRAGQVAGAGVRDGDARIAEPANSPTITSPAMTGAAMILGTAAYMSPGAGQGASRSTGAPTSGRSAACSTRC